MKHIFLVEDEKSIRDIIKKYLENGGYKVTDFINADHVISEMHRAKPDLLVLDIMLPGVSGLELCKEIRKSSEIPIIFVTAKGEEIDRIIGLELGADDYISKPFSPRELVLRINNIFKRFSMAGKNPSKVIKIKDIIIYCDKRNIEKDGKEIKMTLKEYDLFEFLSENKDKPYTREQLLDEVWGYEFAGNTRIVDDVIKRIRKKLCNSGSLVEIATVWGYGYKLEG